MSVHASVLEDVGRASGTATGLACDASGLKHDRAFPCLTFTGQWRGGAIAVKVIRHDASLSRKVDTLRESLVGISMQHPCVVRPPARQLEDPFCYSFSPGMILSAVAIDIMGPAANQAQAMEGHRTAAET